MSYIGCSSQMLPWELGKVQQQEMVCPRTFEELFLVDLAIYKSSKISKMTFCQLFKTMHLENNYF